MIDIQYILDKIDNDIIYIIDDYDTRFKVKSIDSVVNNDIYLILDNNLCLCLKNNTRFKIDLEYIRQLKINSL